MFKLLILFILNVCFTSTFDLTATDYCHLECKTEDNEVITSAACDCRKKEDRDDMTNYTQSMRRIAVVLHNKLRNMVARGNASNRRIPKASNMHVVSYDLELEYLARCFLYHKFVGKKEGCVSSSYCNNCQQNIYINSKFNDSLDTIKSAIQSWYNEVKKIPEESRESEMRSYSGNPDWKQFITLIWADVYRIGCGWVKISDMNINVVACNYAALPKNDSCQPGVKFKPVFIPGEPCSQCGNEKCNDNYFGGTMEGLCGEIITLTNLDENWIEEATTKKKAVRQKKVPEWIEDWEQRDEQIQLKFNLANFILSDNFAIFVTLIAVLCNLTK